MLLQQCLELRYLDLSDRVRRWNSRLAKTIRPSHSSLRTRGRLAAEYSTARYAALTTVIDQCSSARYSRLITEEILNRLGTGQFCAKS